MAYDDSRDKKASTRMSYADLFKISSSSSSNQSMSSWESSSLSDFSSPLGSELASSSESDDGDFAFELSRQMAEVMLQETEKEEQSPFPNEASGGHVKMKKSSRSYGLPPLEVHQLRNQPPPTVEAGHAHQKTEHRHHHSYNHRQKQSYRGRNSNAGQQVCGSGMRAVFLGGKGSGQGSSGTGVFLPRSANDPTSVNKPQTGGCSTVLIPTRVLQALELHFNRLQESQAQQPSLSSGGYHDQQCFKEEYSRKSQVGHSSQELKNEYENNDNEDMRLPQEWTY